MISPRAGRKLLAALTCAGACGLAPPSLGQTAGDGYRLRLDHELRESSTGSGALPAATLVRFGMTDLQRRVLQARDERDQLQRLRQLAARKLADREQLIGELQKLTRAQDGAIAALSTGLQASAVAEDRASTGSVAAPAPPPAPAQAVTKKPADPAPGAGGQWGGFIARFSTERFVVDASLLTLLVLCLGWGLSMRSKVRGAEAQRQEAETRALREVAAKANAAVASPPPAPAPAPAYIAAAPIVPADGEARQASAGAQPVPASMARPKGAPLTPATAAGEPDDLPGDGGEVGDADWSQRVVQRKAVDPNALREVDTLIAFEDFDHAARLLQEMVGNNPDNPEYRLRLMHVEAERGNLERSAAEEEILVAMMDGPLSETIGRVKEIGRGMVPGHRLFADEPVARQVQGSVGAAFLPSNPDTVEVPTLDADAHEGLDQGPTSIDPAAAPSDEFDSMATLRLKPK